MEADPFFGRTIGSYRSLPARQVARLTLALVLSAYPAWMGCSSTPGRLPPGFEGAFILPDAGKDQYGNRVVACNGSRRDPETGWAYEVWLKEPRMELVLIPAGSFDMGSPESEVGREPREGPVHKVTFARPFYIGKYEVTQGQWEAVMGGNPSSMRAAGRDAPVECVSWYDCLAFIQRLCKSCVAENLMGKPSEFRFPSEAEWEYACRAGTRTALYTGPLTIRGDWDGPELDPIAWYRGNSAVKYEGGSVWPGHAPVGTHPVGRKKPNSWGLYDMIGNVMEWCQDTLELVEGYVGAPTDGSTWLDDDGNRVVRGGCHSSPPGNCRSARRGGCWGTFNQFSSYGLRLAISPRLP